MNSDLTNQLLQLKHLDQQARQSFPIDFSIDRENAATLRGLIQQYGWPTVDLVGREASEAAWLIVQHADHDVAFQEECLRAMESSNADPVLIAYLTDRVLKNKGLPQRFGTQAVLSEEGLVLWEMDDIDLVQKRRASLNMKPLYEYLASLQERQRRMNDAIV